MAGCTERVRSGSNFDQMEIIMRNIVLPLLLIASLGASSVAMAASPTTTKGVLQAMDAKTCTVTLADKSIYQFAPKCDFSKLKAGEKVAVTWTLNGKINQASAIVAAS